VLPICLKERKVKKASFFKLTCIGKLIERAFHSTKVPSLWHFRTKWTMGCSILYGCPGFLELYNRHTLINKLKFCFKSVTYFQVPSQIFLCSLLFFVWNPNEKNTSPILLWYTCIGTEWYKECSYFLFSCMCYIRIAEKLNRPINRIFFLYTIQKMEAQHFPNQRCSPSVRLALQRFRPYDSW